MSRNLVPDLEIRILPDVDRRPLYMTDGPHVQHFLINVQKSGAGCGPPFTVYDRRSTCPHPAGAGFQDPACRMWTAVLQIDVDRRSLY